MVKVIVRFVCKGDEYDGKVGVLVDNSIVTGESNIRKHNSINNSAILFRNGQCFTVARSNFRILSVDKSAKNLKIPRGIK